MNSVLYVSYDGLKEPLGQSQVWPYVRGLAEKGYEFELLSYEKPGVPLRYREKLMPGVYWTALRYHKKFSILATLFDLKLGFFVASWLILTKRVKFMHARSYVPALLVYVLSIIYQRPWIFDTRGLWADEKVDSGAWDRRSFVYRFFKKVEGVFFKQASALVVLTERFKEYLHDKTSVPVVVIPTCVDLESFSFKNDEKSPSGVLVYLGSLGGLYMGKEILQFYRYWRKFAKNPKLWVISHSNFTSDEPDVHYLKVDYTEIPALLQKAQASVCFIKPAFSKLASAPTKLGELLACGIPVAANVIGDMGLVLGDSSAGVLVRSFDDSTLEKCAHELWEHSSSMKVRREARALAEKWFSLENAVQKYGEIYERF